MSDRHDMTESAPAALSRDENEALAERLIAIREDLGRDRAERFMAMLILLLANRTGDAAAVEACIAAALKGLDPP